MNNKNIPLIKEYRINNLIECLRCIDRFIYDREKQRDCVLKIYPNLKDKPVEHREKSIFRGMIIPSLRYLGLIIGFADFIKPSANGKIIIESQSIDNKLYERVLRAVIYEIDMLIFGFIPIINKSFLPKKEFIKRISDKIESISEKQKLERINKWLSILHQVKLIDLLPNAVSVIERNLRLTYRDIDIRLKNNEDFKRHFFESYSELAKDSAGVVDIRLIREAVSLKMLMKHKTILTERQFDELLKRIPFETNRYIISLGEPMGAEQKLFEYKGNYFRTLYIKFYKEAKT